MVIDIPFFTMVNIIANERVYEEYLQGDVNAMNLADSLERILPGGERRKDVEEGMRRVVDALSAGSGRSSARAAEAALAVALKNKKGEGSTCPTHPKN
jgi:lipid-A-disaccharide synthase